LVNNYNVNYVSFFKLKIITFDTQFQFKPIASKNNITNVLQCNNNEVQITTDRGKPMSTLSPYTNNLAYFSKTPFIHGGIRVDHAMTSLEALNTAKLNFEVEKFPMETIVDGKRFKVPERFVIVVAGLVGIIFLS